MNIDGNLGRKLMLGGGKSMVHNNSSTRTILDVI